MRGLCLLALAVVLASSTAIANAHVGHVVVSAERYLKLDLGGHRARLVVSLTLGPDEGARVRADADVDRSGEVDASEAEAYLASWAEGLATEVPVTVHGHAVAPAWRDGFMDPLGPVRAEPLTLELVGHFELGEGEHPIQIVDQMVGRDVFDRTDVSFQARDGAALLACGRVPVANDAIPDGCVGEIAYGRTRPSDPDVTLFAVARAPRSPRPEVSVKWDRLGAALLITALAMALVVLAGRRRG